MGRQRIHGWNEKRGTRKANYGPGVYRGPLMCLDGLILRSCENIETPSWPVLLVKHLPWIMCVHNGPRRAQTRPLGCSGAEVGASLATKSKTVTADIRLTVANCPTQGCTIRRFCWDDQHHQRFRNATHKYDPTDSQPTPNRINCQQLAHFSHSVYISMLMFADISLRNDDKNCEMKEWYWNVYLQIIHCKSHHKFICIMEIYTMCYW